MAIPETFIGNTGSLANFLKKIKDAGVPERVTFEFLKTLGFKSSNDRPIIPVMKAIGFLDQNGVPTELYRAYRSNDGERVLAEAVRSAYSDVFLANTKAHTLSVDKLKGIIASKTTKGASVVERIARTFQTLAKAADFSAPEDKTAAPGLSSRADVQQEQEETQVPSLRDGAPTFHYNIEIHLPTTTDISVYNAIFRSLKENLL